MSMNLAVAGWLLGTHSGANRRLLALLEEAHAFLDDDDRVTVLCQPSFTPPPLPRIEWRSVAIPGTPTWRRAFAEQRQLGSLLHELGANVYDHGFLPAPRVGIPLCLTIHDVRAADNEGNWPPFIARSVLRKSLRRAAGVVTVSEWTASRLRALMPSCKPQVVANGVHDLEPGPLPQPIPPNGYILHVGHLEPRKNLGVLLEALARIEPAQRPELWLVGRDAGSWSELNKQAGRLGVQAFVRHIGIVSDRHLPAYYHDARLLALPSRYEGFGLPALEARIHGTRVAVANTTALPEVVGDGAKLPVNDPAAWARVMAESPNENLQTIQRRAADAAACSWSNASHAWLNILRKLVREPLHRRESQRTRP